MNTMKSSLWLILENAFLGRMKILKRTQQTFAIYFHKEYTDSIFVIVNEDIFVTENRCIMLQSFKFNMFAWLMKDFLLICNLTGKIIKTFNSFKNFLSILEKSDLLSEKQQTIQSFSRGKTINKANFIKRNSKERIPK